MGTLYGDFVVVEFKINQTFFECRWIKLRKNELLWVNLLVISRPDSPRKREKRRHPLNNYVKIFGEITLNAEGLVGSHIKTPSRFH